MPQSDWECIEDSSPEKNRKEPVSAGEQQHTGAMGSADTGAMGSADAGAMGYADAGAMGSAGPSLELSKGSKVDASMSNPSRIRPMEV